MARRRARSIQPLDFRRMARGMAQQGNDLRHWVSYATVATANGDDGTMDPTDSHAVLVTPAGVEVDVVLEPSGYPCTARYGVAAGSCSINTPIRPGDQVIVGIPDGDVSMVPQIFCIISGSSDPMPTGDDGLPIFKNDRLMIHAGAGVPIEIRTANGTMVRITDDLVEVGGQGVTEQAILGTTQREAEAALNSADTLPLPTAGLQGIWNGAQGVCAGPLAPLKPFFVAATLAIQEYEAKADGFLSDVVKLR
jgi:hypothetical protein